MTTGTQLTTWSPKESKYIKWLVNGGLILGGVWLGSILINAFVPTLNDALRLITLALSNGITMAITGAGLIIVLWLLNEMFSSQGAINRLFGQAYSNFINKMTMALIEIDPIAPLMDKRKEMEQRKTVFDQALQNFTGTVSRLRGSKEKYLSDADEAEKKARAAKSMVDKGKTEMEATLQSHLYQTGRYREVAADFAKMEGQLTPVITTLRRVQTGLVTIISNIDVDIRIAEDQWQAQKDMAEANKSARGVLKTSRDELAMRSLNVIQQKYGEAFGRLDDLTNITKPFLDSIDLDNARYSEELLLEWQTKSIALLEAPKGGNEVRIAVPDTTPRVASDIGRLMDE